MLWVVMPAGFENLVEAVGVPAEAMSWRASVLLRTD